MSRRTRCHRVDAQHAPPTIRVAVDGRDHGSGGDAAPAAALDAGRRRAVEEPCEEFLAVGVQARRDGVHLALQEPGDAHLLGHPLQLAGAGVGGVHLVDGGHGGAVNAPVALVHVLREEAAGAQLGNVQRQCADAGGERPLAVAVSAVRPAAAQLLGKAPEQLLHVDDAVVETGHGEHVRRRV